MKYRILIALLALGLSSSLIAAEKTDYPRISFVGAGTGKTPIDHSQYIALVVEGPYLTFEKNPIPANGEVEYVNNLLKVRGVSYLGVYSRAGVKYGDIVRAIDVLRKTNAKDVGVSLIELPADREP
jgi:hypothetical protein